MTNLLLLLLLACAAFPLLLLLLSAAALMLVMFLVLVLVLLVLVLLVLMLPDRLHRLSERLPRGLPSRPSRVLLNASVWVSPSRHEHVHVGRNTPVCVSAAQRYELVYTRQPRWQQSRYPQSAAHRWTGGVRESSGCMDGVQNAIFQFELIASSQNTDGAVAVEHSRAKPGCFRGSYAW